MTRLKLLGGAVLEDESGRLGGAAAHRPSLALLALLALAPSRTLSRGKVVGLLWPGTADEAARNRLNTCLYRLRRKVGADVVVSEGQDLRLNHLLVGCDVTGFEEALEGGALEEAVQQYQGPFLDGFWISDSPEFDQWMDGERARLARRYREALGELARSAWEAEEPKAAAGWWRKLWREEPFDSDVTLRLMNALAASGQRMAALRVADQQTEFLQTELGAGPDAEVQELARRLREGSAPEAPRTGGGPGTAGRSATDELDPNVVAILPFENLGGGEEGRVFAAGLHHDLLTQLSRSEELKVISRTSVIQYGEGRTSVPEIARTLGAGTVVEGGLQYASGRIRLNVQMVDGRADEHRWAETYDRQITTEGLFEIQTELAKRIAASLQTRLTAGLGKGGKEGPMTSSLEAYRLQVQGRARLAERSERGMREGVEYFRQAIQADPEYPLAWVGLADGLTLIYGYTDEVAERTLPEAEMAARRALELDPELGEAHASLGLLHEVRHRGVAAIRQYRRAVALRPSYAEGHNWLSWLSQVLGRAEEAMEAARRAVELNPLSMEAVGNLATSYLHTGDPVTALREIRRGKALQSEVSTYAFYEALILHRLGRVHEAKELLQGVSEPWAGSGAESTLAFLQAVSGEVEAARQAVARFEAGDDPFAAGVVLAGLGEHGEALAALERVQRWDWWPALAMHFHFPHEFEPLRADPRFGSLMEGVHEYWGLEPDGSLPREA